MSWKSAAILVAGSALANFTVAVAPLVAQSRTDGGRFLEAVKNRDGDTVMALLGEPGSTLVNAREANSGRTALHEVVARRDLTWLRFLLDRGANPDIADTNGATPLALAAQAGFVEGVEALAAKGAQVDVADSTGETPLIAAIHRRDSATVEALLAKGANPARTDNSGRSARDYAALMKNGQLLEILAKSEEARAARDRNYGPN